MSDVINQKNKKRLEADYHHERHLLLLPSTQTETVQRLKSIN